MADTRTIDEFWTNGWEKNNKYLSSVQTGNNF